MIYAAHNCYPAHELFVSHGARAAAREEAPAGYAELHLARTAGVDIWEKESARGSLIDSEWLALFLSRAPLL